ncbi:allergen Tha p 1-like isoform X2 [Schistocerca serialis cubense]|uniref:allergen Tha p 1-like isoform X1 n=1 Tax=Schistocerca serialis cubense TaxID=2023355 RepID=UPI00214EF1A8|nr:allergen Tha p 1-like isoform X1 [Schistocerca serialis cubense]XP_049963357.1 allergen Tha p 1-like isoform X2 [Schistocerca serialis cubense]
MQKCTLALLLACLVAAAAAYTTKYDNIDLDDVLHNDRLLKKYHECLLSDSDASCTPDGKELKAAIPDALTNDCAKCNEKQKAGAEKVIRFLIKEKPDLWTPLENKYDPTGTYRQKYGEELKRVSA